MKEKYSNSLLAASKRVSTLNQEEDPKDDRDYVFGLSEKILPDTSSLMDYCPPIKNQGSIGSCGGFAFGAAYEILKKKKDYRYLWDVSELFIYYCARGFQGWEQKDSGIYLRDGCKALVKFGASLELFHPYVAKNLAKYPSWMASFAGRATKAKTYYRCYSTGSIMEAVAQGFPVVFGMYVYWNYLTLKKHVVYNTKKGDYKGGHAQVIVGYDNNLKAFLVRNSWGPKWGNGGYALVSYDVVEESLIDAWVIVI